MSNLPRYDSRSLDPRDFVDYLHRLADAVEKGEARGDVVLVDRGEREHVDEIFGATRDHYAVRMCGAETHEIRVTSLRHIEVKRCIHCGQLHEVGACPQEAPERTARLLGPGCLGDDWP